MLRGCRCPRGTTVIVKNEVVVDIGVGAHSATATDATGMLRLLASWKEPLDDTGRAVARASTRSNSVVVPVPRGHHGIARKSHVLPPE